MKKDAELGGILYRLYRDAMELESIATKGSEACEDLTVNELYLIESISAYTKDGKGPAISTIASALDITRPSATVAVNKLTDKEMVVKTASEDDGRSVRVKLTDKGEKALAAHRSFQKLLNSDLHSEISSDDNVVITKALGILDSFLDKKIEEHTGRNRKILEREKRRRDDKKAPASAKKAAPAKTAKVAAAAKKPSAKKAAKKAK